jgi:hypothetical protein
MNDVGIFGSIATTQYTFAQALYASKKNAFGLMTILPQHATVLENKTL